MYRCVNGHEFDEPKTATVGGFTVTCCPVGECGAQAGLLPTPESIKPHADDYKDGSWSEYSLTELGGWVALLCRRSSHRSNLKKRQKDLHDARNYLNMLCAQVSHLEDQLYETLCLEDGMPENYIGGVDLCGADK